LETLLPLTLRLVEEHLLSLETAIACVAYHPALIINKEKGNLGVGQAADFILFDPNKPMDIHRQTFRSKGKNNPFFGWGFSGSVIETRIAGVQVYHHS
jgi:dihydroorotase